MVLRPPGSATGEEPVARTLSKEYFRRMPTPKGARRADTTPRTGQATREAALASAGDPREGDQAASGPAYRRLSDPRELAALAHPVRLGIMELLAGRRAAHRDRAGRPSRRDAGQLLVAPAQAGRALVRGGGRRRHRATAALACHPDRTGLGRRRRHPRRAARRPRARGDAPPAPGHALPALALAPGRRRRPRLGRGRRRARSSPAGSPSRSSTSSTSRSAPCSSGTPTGSPTLRKRPAGSRLCEFVAWGAPVLLPGVDAVPDRGHGRRGRGVS